MNLLELKFDVKHLMNHEYYPNEDYSKYMSADEIAKMTITYNQAEKDVLFDGAVVRWDSCDCGDGYGCSHGSWPYEIRFTYLDKHGIDFVDDGLEFSGPKGSISISTLEGFTMGDFVRFCQLCGIELKPKTQIDSNH